jgi:hypothetical protein
MKNKKMKKLFKMKQGFDENSSLSICTTIPKTPVARGMS